MTEQELIDFDFRMLKEYEQVKKENKIKEFEFIKEIEKEFPEMIIQIKEQKIEDLTKAYKEIIENYQKSYWRGTPNWLIEAVKSINNPDKIAKEIKKLKSDIEFLKGKKFLEEGKITPEEIVKAKNHPFDALAELVNGKTICPFHPEKTPSFSIHKQGNFGYCFGCGKGVDTIQYVMETKNLNFVEAVKYLQ